MGGSVRPNLPLNLSFAFKNICWLLLGWPDSRTPYFGAYPWMLTHATSSCPACLCSDFMRLSPACKAVLGHGVRRGGIEATLIQPEFLLGQHKCDMAGLKSTVNYRLLNICLGQPRSRAAILSLGAFSSSIFCPWHKGWLCDVCRYRTSTVEFWHVTEASRLGNNSGGDDDDGVCYSFHLSSPVCD